MITPNTYILMAYNNTSNNFLKTKVRVLHSISSIFIAVDPRTKSKPIYLCLWNLSGSNRVSRYQKKHSPTTLIVVINHPYLLSLSTNLIISGSEHSLASLSLWFWVIFLSYFIKFRILMLERGGVSCSHYFSCFTFMVEMITEWFWRL